MKKICIGLLISAVTLIVTLVVVELGFRIIEARQDHRAQWSDRPRYYFQHAKSPDLKDYPYTREKPENTFRIGVVGDSFTFAPYMQFTDSFPKILERMLRLSGGPLNAEVINYGVPGYSTTHEVEATEEALRASADLIILQITLNDPELKPYRPTGIKEFNRFGALKPSPWQAFIFRHWHSARFVAERLHNTNTEKEYVKYFFDLHDNSRTQKTFHDALKQIASASKNKGTPIVAVLFPLFGTPLDDRYPFQPIHEQIKTYVDSLGVPLLDLYSTYSGIPLDRLQVIPGGDRHPNEIAHRMAAENIYDWLVAINLIPESLKIENRFKGRTQIKKEEPFQE